MNLVSWNNSIQIKKRKKFDDIPDEDKLWTNLITPRSIPDLIGNTEAIDQIKNFFHGAEENRLGSACLFLHGESGTGKSTSVSVVAREMGFHTVHTYADQQRTPVRLEGVVREAGIYGYSGVVVLDDFEIFLSETASLKLLSKFLRGLIKDKSTSSRCLFVIISNSTHKLFQSLQEVSTVVEFKRLSRMEMQRVFNRVQKRVRGHSYVPPMAAFLASSSCSGTITQGVQQLQFMYSKNKEPRFVRRPRDKKKRDKKNGTLSTANNRDSVTYLWSDMYTDKMLSHITDKNFNRDKVMERLMGFGKDKLDILSDQVHKEYPRRVAIGGIKNVNKMSKVAGDISLSDINRIEVHEDGLFDGENKEKWSENDVNFVSGITSAVLELKGLQERDITRRKKQKVRINKYKNHGNPMDLFYTNIIENSS